MIAPQLLAPDNFTPPVRTPWGGARIVAEIKHQLVDRSFDCVGESWEVSVEPSFPSRLAKSEQTLAELIAADPAGWLGESVSRAFGQLPLLVKLLDTADNLSVQVHPFDGDPHLAADESGKPESWIILDAEPGAGLYLGLRPEVSRHDVERCLSQSGPLNELLNFVEVAPGDVFVIDAGTIHAIGAGVTLVEPQFVAPGKRGVTYRFWDWNRRYDEHGHPDPTGAPRQLHVSRSLAVTQWDGPRGEEFVSVCRGACWRALAGKPTLSRLLERQVLVSWPWFSAEGLVGTGDLSFETGQFVAVTCIAGELTIQSAAGAVVVPAGQSAAVPARATDVVFTADDAVAVLASPGSGFS